jgi:hypothetical protein
MVVARRLGDALAIAGRAADAVPMLERSRAIGPSLLGGPNGPAVRAVMTQVTARLAVLRAASGSVAAGRREADAAAAEVAKATLGGPLVDALVHEQLGQAYLTVAGRAGGEAEAAALAREHLAASARLWKAARLAGPLEPRRTAALARLDHALARLEPGRR